MGETIVNVKQGGVSRGTLVKETNAKYQVRTEVGEVVWWYKGGCNKYNKEGKKVHW